MIGNMTLKEGATAWTPTGGSDVVYTQLAPGLYRNLALAANLRDEIQISSNPRNDNARSDYLIKFASYADPVSGQVYGSKDNLMEVYTVVRVNWSHFTEAQVQNKMSALCQLIGYPIWTSKILKGDS